MLLFCHEQGPTTSLFPSSLVEKIVHKVGRIHLNSRVLGLKTGSAVNIVCFALFSSLSLFLSKCLFLIRTFPCVIQNNLQVMGF